MGKGKRSISDEFLKKLDNDSNIHNVLRGIVRRNLDFCFELREKRATLYYRGKVLLELKERGNEALQCVICGNARGKEGEEINTCEITEHNIMLYSKEIDDHLGRDKKYKYKEGEYQFRIAHASSINHALEDKYLCVDSEYKQFQADKWRFDLVAIKKEKETKMISLIEVKYGNNSLRTRSPNKNGKNGNPGIYKHLKDFISAEKGQKKILQIMKNDFGNVLRQKNQLGLIGSMPDSVDFDLDKVEYIFVICNYDSTANNNLKDELDEIKNDEKLYQSCKNSTFFYFVNYDESNTDVQNYKLSSGVPGDLFSLDTIMAKYSGK